jgi:hypothetical protein
MAPPKYLILVILKRHDVGESGEEVEDEVGCILKRCCLTLISPFLMWLNLKLRYKANSSEEPGWLSRIATSSWLDSRRIEILHAEGMRDFPPLHSVQTESGANPVSYTMGSGGIISGGKAVGA